MNSIARSSERPYWCFKSGLPAKANGRTGLSEHRDPDAHGLSGRSGLKEAASARLRSDKRHIVRAAEGIVMFYANKTESHWIVLTLLTAAMFAQGAPLRAAGPVSNNEGVVAAQQNEIKEAQEMLQYHGYYRGKADGVLDSRTQASIRAYQRAENLPVTGLLDVSTAGKLGTRPQRPEVVGHNDTTGKPSAFIRRAKGSGAKPLRKEARTIIAPDKGREGSEKTLEADDSHSKPRSGPSNFAAAHAQP